MNLGQAESFYNNKEYILKILYLKIYIYYNLYLFICQIIIPKI